MAFDNDEAFKYEFALVHTTPWESSQIAANLGYSMFYPEELFIRGRDGLNAARWHQLSSHNGRRFEIEQNPYQLSMRHDLYKVTHDNHWDLNMHSSQFMFRLKDVELQAWLYMSNEQDRFYNDSAVQWPPVLIYVRKAGSLIYQIDTAQFPSSSFDKSAWDVPYIPCSIDLVTMSGDTRIVLQCPLSTLGDFAKHHIRQFANRSIAWTVHVVCVNGDLLDDNDIIGEKMFGSIPYFFMVPKGIVGSPEQAIKSFEFNKYEIVLRK